MLGDNQEPRIFVYIMRSVQTGLQQERYKNKTRLNPWRPLRSKTIMNTNKFNVEEKGETI